jgi:LysR family hydrogen peroxide-inducible transcriptional activator
MLQDAEDIRGLALASQDPLSGSLKVGLIPTLGPYLLPRVAPMITRTLPKISLLLHEYQTAPLVERTLAGELDLAILALPADTRGLVTRPLFEEPFLVAIPATHRFAARKRVKAADLEGEKLLLLEEGHCLRDQALEVCSHVGTEEQAFRATSLETLRQMVASGLGVTLLPGLAAEGPFASAHGLVVRPFTPPTPHRVIGAAWRRSTSRGVAIAAVCELIARAG